MLFTRAAMLAAVVATAPASAIAASPNAAATQPAPAFQQIHWPPGTVEVPFEDLDGVMLLQATATGNDGRDTSGAFVLDTGAGYIALDEPLAVRLGIAARHSNGQIEFTSDPLPRFRLAELDIQQAQALIFDADVIRSVVDRPVLGLFGQQPMNDRALCLDYQAKRIALIPAAAQGGANTRLSASRQIVSGVVSPSALALPFRVAAGGKVLVRVRVVPRQGTPSEWRTFVFDTGATKCALFVGAEDDEKRAASWRPALHALETPTLLGRSSASLIRAARVEVKGMGTNALDAKGAEVGGAEAKSLQAKGLEEDGPSRIASATDVDVLLVDSPLGQELSRVTGDTVSGLLGYSFLRHFRVVCDYPNRVLWLDPAAGFREDRPYEHSHLGLQLERRDGAVRVMSVAKPSPAERAGIRPGDEVITIDRVAAAQASLLKLDRLMEGQPGTELSLTIRRGEHEMSYRLRRQRLL